MQNSIWKFFNDIANIAKFVNGNSFQFCVTMNFNVATEPVMFYSRNKLLGLLIMPGILILNSEHAQLEFAVAKYRPKQ